MRQPSEIPEIAATIELGFLSLIAGLVEHNCGWELVRDPHPNRSGSSCTLRNRAGVEIILDAEATWKPEAMTKRLEELLEEEDYRS